MAALHEIIFTTAEFVHIQKEQTSTHLKCVEIVRSASLLFVEKKKIIHKTV